MQFIYPSFLWALLSIGIPVIIHLYNFRRYKKVYFTNVSFLKDIQQATKAQSRLKHLLILLCRILAIIFLVLAFTQPFIPVTNKSIAGKGINYVSVFVDNSFSMDNKNEHGRLLDEAIEKARAVADAYKPGDKFQLLTQDLAPSEQHFVSRDEFLQLLYNIKISTASHFIGEIHNKQYSSLSKQDSKNKQAFIISDFQRSMMKNTDNSGLDTSIIYYYLPLKANSQNNIYIDTCFLTSPVVLANQANELHIKLTNKSSKKIDALPVKLNINGIDKAINNISLEAKESKEFVLSFTPQQTGWNNAVVSIIDNPITFDNTFYFSFFINQSLKVLCINGNTPNQYINALLGNDKYFLLNNTNEVQIDHGQIAQSNLVILNELNSIPTGLSTELGEFIKKGGSVAVFPNRKGNTDTYNSFLRVSGASTYGELIKTEAHVEKLDKQHPLLNDVFAENKNTGKADLPFAKQYYKLNKNAIVASYSIASFENGDPMLMCNDILKGHIYNFAVPLDKEFSSLPEHLLFVPIMYKMALLAQQNLYKSQIVGNIGPFEIPIKNASLGEILHIKQNEKKIDIIPAFRNYSDRLIIDTKQQIKDAANYSITNDKDDEIGLLSYNYSRIESDLTPADESVIEQLGNKFSNNNSTILKAEDKLLTKAIKENSRGIALWKICILLVLLSLSAEIALIKFLK